MAFAADPVASLIDTAFIGRLGPVEIAAVGVAIAIFNQASKVTIFPLVSITTSFVAEEDTLNRNTKIEAEKTQDLKKDAKSGEAKEPLPDDEMLDNMEKVSDTNSGKNIENKDSVSEDDCKTITISSSTHTDSTKSVNPKQKKERRHFPSASTALIFGSCLLQAIFLIIGAKPLLHIMGVKSGSAMLNPARKYLTLRALGSPAVLLSLAMQGVFRGFKDTKTPLYATVIGDLTNIILDPYLSSSAAGVSVVLLLLTSFPRFLLLARVIAATICVTLAASRAARLGSTAMAAFQICLQVWLTSSLLADGLAVAGQAIIACAIADKDYQKATAAATRVLQMSFILGLGLAVVVGLGLHFGDIIFSKDLNVLHFIAIGIPFVAGTQPINAIAFVFDGVNFGASDFAYSSYSMASLSATVHSRNKQNNLSWICWNLVALTIFMGLRTFAGVLRMGTGTGPWRFLRGRLLP
uniref:Protein DETOXIFICATION n=1 Tax=Salix viminalis TaxID=40686 RepID=A0A6N2LV62_SALVM